VHNALTAAGRVKQDGGKNIPALVVCFVNVAFGFYQCKNAFFSAITATIGGSEK
jgi:hypothetical protein